MRWDPKFRDIVAYDFGFDEGDFLWHYESMPIAGKIFGVIVASINIPGLSVDLFDVYDVCGCAGILFPADENCIPWTVVFTM